MFALFLCLMLAALAYMTFSRTLVALTAGLFLAVCPHSALGTGETWLACEDGLGDFPQILFAFAMQRLHSQPRFLITLQP